MQRTHSIRPLLVTAHRPAWAMHVQRALGAFGRDRSGAVAITVGLCLSVMLGLAALGTEVGDWYLARRTMQGATDSAAYSAALAKAGGAALGVYTSEAQSVTGSYGYVDGANGVIVTVGPPTQGNHMNDPTAVQVVISQPQPLVLASLFLSTAPTIQTRAVAVARANGNGCVLALDRGDVTDVFDVGNTTLNLNNCNIVVNSPSSSALTLTGGATINANAAYISGNYTTTGHAALNTTNGTFTGVAPILDPYADMQIPGYSGCNQSNFALSAGASRTFSPGTSGVMVFCNGFSLTGGSNVTLQAGTYIIDGGSFSMSGNSTLSGTDVTIILTSSSGSNYATVSITGGSTVNLSAPTSGSLAGMAFFQDRNAPASGSDSFSGGTTQNINGAIYFPNQNVTFNGGTSTGGAQCTQLIAFTIRFNGNAAFNTNCAGKGVRGIGNQPIQLVE